MSFNEKYKVNQKFADLFEFDSEAEEIKHDAYMLMARYLSEIEKIQTGLKINRKELAQKINTSPSYLTQVFRGDKPLNFETVAKIQKALAIQFEVTIKSNTISPFKFIGNQIRYQPSMADFLADTIEEHSVAKVYKIMSNSPVVNMQYAS